MFMFIWIAIKYYRTLRNEAANGLLDIALAIQAGVTHAVTDEYPEKWKRANLLREEWEMAHHVSMWMRKTGWFKDYKRRAMDCPAQLTRLDLFLHDRLPPLFKIKDISLVVADRGEDATRDASGAYPVREE